MGSTSKWAGFVDETIPGLTLQHWATAIAVVGERFPASRAERLGSEQRLTLGQVGRSTSEFEMAALGPADAIALDRTLGKIVVDLAHFIERGCCFERTTHTGTPAMACPAIHPVVHAD